MNIPNTQELLRASEEQLPSLLERMKDAITGSCQETRQAALAIIQATVDICHPELPLTNRLKELLQVQAGTYRGSDYTEIHYNF